MYVLASDPSAGDVGDVHEGHLVIFRLEDGVFDAETEQADCEVECVECEGGVNPGAGVRCVVANDDEECYKG